MFRWFKELLARRDQAVVAESAVTVEIKDDLVTASYPDGSTQTIDWITLQRVEIHTNDSGPWGADVWWILFGPDGQCSYPGGATGEAEILERLQRLPGFDNDQLIEAMGCTANRRFTCWQAIGTADHEQQA